MSSRAPTSLRTHHTRTRGRQHSGVHSHRPSPHRDKRTGLAWGPRRVSGPGRGHVTLYESLQNPEEMHTAPMSKAHKATRRTVCPPLHGTRHAMSTQTGGRRPRATHAPAQVGSSARTCNSHAEISGELVPKQLNKTSYSMRESLSGALMEYSFVHASANPNDGLP